MSNYLRFNIQGDTDGTGELTVTVHANGFGGCSSAWFNLSEIATFAQNLTQFPLPASSCIALRGGYWTQSAPARIEQEHVGIEVYPVGGTGVIGIRVRLATPLQESDRPNDFFQVIAELKTSYAELGRFADAVQGIAGGVKGEALLRAEEV